ncbi:alpha/beta fold hydrolase [Aurantiacibacter flavus]|uniref:Alpha/beta fold hydrolase n=1 Tax=Aurantiacibacter flavus TaxID=3145232 RepID=A0ABV0CV12_9SPHN
MTSFALVLATTMPATAQESVAPQGSALEAQRANGLPLTSFYDPDGADLSVPGTLVRTEAGMGYDLPHGIVATRIAYASRDANGIPVMTTGVVLQPPGEAPEGGWPLIAWGHGTAGVARPCAPSLMKDLYYGWDGIFIYPLMGYAVVATDYSGLGTPGPHQLLSLEAQGQDVINSVPAARAAVPTLSDDWVMVGHSQGGATAIQVSAMEHGIDDPTYLGAISIAPATDYHAMWKLFPDGMASGGMALVAAGIRAADPSFDPETMVGPQIAEVLPELEQEACFGAAMELVASLPGARQPSNWPDAPGVRRFTDANRPYLQPGRGPLLVLLGENDPAIPLDITKRAIGERCKLQDEVSLETYPGMDHAQVIHASFPRQLEWIADRFAGRPAERNCPG